MTITTEEVYPGMSMKELELVIYALRALGKDTVEPNELADKLEKLP